MTDIIEKLRINAAEAKSRGMDLAHDDLTKAADKLERMEAELDALRAYMAQHAPMELRGFDIRGEQPENPENWK